MRRTRSPVGTFRWLCALAVVFVLPGIACGQELRFTTGHREFAVPDYAPLQIGRFYSNIKFTESVEIRYARVEGAVDELTGVHRGVIRESGPDFPIISTLMFRNYLVISKHADLDVSFWLRYSLYPLDTQENQFTFSLPAEGVKGDISAEWQLADTMRLRAYWCPSYKTDYIDLRGLTDRYGGRRHRHFSSAAGLDYDWLVQKDMNLAVSVVRSDSVPYDEIFETQRHTRYGGNLSLEYRLTPALLGGINAGYQFMEYPSATWGQRFMAQSYGLFARTELSDFTSMSLSGGYSVADLTSASPDYPDISSGTFIGSLALNMEPAKKLAHSISLNRTQSRGFTGGIEVGTGARYQIDFDGDFWSIGLGASISEVDVAGYGVGGYRNWSLRAGASRPLSDFSSVRLSSVYSVRQNPGSAADTDDGVEDELVSDYWTWTAKVSYDRELGRTSRMTVYVDYAVRGSDAESLDYSRFATGLGASYSHEF